MIFGIFKKELWTRPLVAWYFYDFANSIFVINGSLYFSQWIVVDKKLTDLWFGLPVILATAILVLISPYYGELGDRNGTHRKILTWATIAAIISGFLLILSGRLSKNLDGVILALLFYFLFQLLYQLAIVPYTAFLKLIANQEQYGAVSGIGYAFNQLGYIFGLLITLPVVNGSIIIFGNDRLAPLIPAVIGFSIFVIPVFFFLKSKPLRNTQDNKIPVLKTLWTNLKESRKYQNLLPLLISFYLFSDAILSLSLYAAVYLQNVFGVPDIIKAKVFLFVVIGASIAAFFAGTVADRIGHRKILIFSLWLMAFTIAAIALVPNISLALFLFPVFGIAWGGVYPSARSYFASLFPNSETGKFFGIYTFAERFASVVGPIVWGTIVYLLSKSFPWNYRFAALSMGLLVLISVLILIFFTRKTLLIKT